jgi:hypothetical protein
MKNLKYGILGLGVLGLLGCFLPFVSFGDMSFSLFAARKGDAANTFMVMGAFAAAAVMGGMALSKPLLKWQAGVAAAGFGLVLLKLRAAITHVFSQGFGIGAKLIIVAAIAGLVVSILAAVKGTEE